MPYCPNCGRILPDYTTKCSNCSRIPQRVQPVGGPSAFPGPAGHAPQRQPVHCSAGDKPESERLCALIEVGDGSQWEVEASTVRSLISKAQNIIGKDLTKERYYIRDATRNGRFDLDLLWELQAGLRS